MKHVALALSVILASLPSATGQAKCATPEPTTDTMFAPGQIWSYRTRPQEQKSTITILRVESTPKMGTIIHVRVNDMRWRSCHGGEAPTTLQHAPFTRSALQQSVKQQTGKVATLPDFAEGYGDWLSHCGGAYAIPVAEVLAMDDAHFSEAQGCR